MKVKITRDQAVWERETFFVEVPDDTSVEDLFEAISDAVDNFQGYHGEGYDKEICDDAVEGVDTQTVAELPDLTTIELT